jgi:2-keto-3-deoxy-L-fuconate dehydrogenase
VSDFSGLVAIVTGGASGIGAATTALLTARGARVAVLDLDASPANRHAISVRCDVTDRRSVRAAIAAVVDRFGGLDVLVNNAGIGATGDVAANTDEEWHHVLDVNVVGTARVSGEALPFLRGSRHAAIVNTCSVAAQVGLPQRALYSASKGAVLSLTYAMAVDHLADGVRVNCVSPGTTDTPWVGRLLENTPDPAAAAAALQARQPINRLVTADEVAHAVAYLASPSSGATTGTVLTVDGGLTGLRPAR